MEEKTKTFWEETIESLEVYGYTWDDVIAVCGDEVSVTKDDFERVAKERRYRYWGPALVAEDLKLFLRDGAWFTRATDMDMQEWWQLHKRPSIPEKVIPLCVLNVRIINEHTQEL